jgi:signal transduction histidine kinase/DNA-binding response OmpR family regulator
MSDNGASRASILVVNDTPADLRFLAEVLTKQGYVVRPAKSGVLALSSAQTELPDLILLDLLMPGMDGYTVCERLKADERTRDVPVIVVSALGKLEDKVKAFSLGAADYITKPFQAEEILARVETHLALQSMQRQLQERNVQLECEITERAQTEEALRQYADEQAALYAITSADAASLDPDALLSTFLSMVLSVTHADAGWVVLPNPSLDDPPRVAAWRGVSKSFVAAEEAAPLRACPICTALLTGGDGQVTATRITKCPRLPPGVMAQAGIASHVCVPLVAGDVVLGLLEIAWPASRSYSDSDQALLTAIGQQIGLALRNARLYRDSRRMDQLEILHAVTAAAVSSLDLDTVLRQLLEVTCFALGAVEGSILFSDPATGGLFFAVTLEDETGRLRGLRLSPGQGIAGWVAEHGQAVCVNDVHDDPRWYDGVDADTGFETRSLLCVPLRHHEEVTGVIEIVNKRWGGFTEDDLSMLEAVAFIAAGAIENARLYASAQARADELAMLNEISLALTSTLDPSAVVRVALFLIQRFFKAEGVALLQVDPQANELYPVQTLVGGRPVEIPIRPQLGEGIVGQVLEQRQPALIKDAQSDPRWLGRVDRYAEQHLGKPMRSVMVAPLLTPEDVSGVLMVASTEPATYTHRELRTLQAIAATLAVALENARLYEAEHAARQQLHDLTAYLQTAREEERTHIAREVHDELGQMLTVLKMDLSWLTRRLSVDKPGLVEKANAMSDLIDEVIQTVRRVATELRPGLLDDLGLTAALEWQAQEFAERTGIDCELHLTDEDLVLDRGLATAIFRIFQETLTNVARHAEATGVRVTLSYSVDELILTVQDNGKGITEDQISDSQSLGLIGMRERARAWGGEVTFEGVPGQGMAVTVRIPREEKGK